MATERCGLHPHWQYSSPRLEAQRRRRSRSPAGFAVQVELRPLIEIGPVLRPPRLLAHDLQESQLSGEVTGHGTAQHAA